jgi:hypothetical protein
MVGAERGTLPILASAEGMVVVAVQGAPFLPSLTHVMSLLRFPFRITFGIANPSRKCLGLGTLSELVNSPRADFISSLQMAAPVRLASFHQVLVSSLTVPRPQVHHPWQLLSLLLRVLALDGTLLGTPTHHPLTAGRLLLAFAFASSIHCSVDQRSALV